MVLYNVPALSAVYSPGSSAPLAPSPLPGVSDRRSDMELTIAAGGLFNISAATFGSLLGRPRLLPAGTQSTDPAP